MSKNSIELAKLIQQWHEAATRVSFYNAAEGSWRQEAEGRAKAYTRYRKVCDQLPKEVLTELKSKGGYLL